MSARAEIPSAQAAAAFAEYGRFGEFETLFLRIEAAGFPLGIEGRLRALVMLSRLSALGMRPDAAQLAVYLVPVLAASGAEQASMRRVVAEWADPEGTAAAIAARSAEAAAAPRAARDLTRVDRGGRNLALALGGAAVAVFVGLVIATLLGGDVSRPGDVVQTIATESRPVVTIEGLNPYWRNMIEDVVSRLGFALVVLAAGFSFLALRGDLKGRLTRQVDETDLVETFALRAAIPDWFRSADARAAFDRLKRVRLFETARIDVPRTVAKSIRAGGLPLVVTQFQRELPNYVLMVDRAGQDDLAGIFARAVEAALADARINYARYDFSGSLGRLNPVRGGAHEDIVDAEYLPFSVLATRHAGERLILIGTGTKFFEPPGFRYDRALRRRVLVPPGTPVPQMIHLREFGAAFLVTPAPASAWGENERQLQALGFQVVCADVGGVQSLAAQLLFETSASPHASAPRAPTDEDAFLAHLDQDATRLSAPLPPAPAEIERLVANLKVWSGDRQIYTLIAAIAAFPKIDTAFTFVLAEMLLEREMDSALFGRLVRLPWIRNGYMPDWLRIALINGLDAEQRLTVRKVQMTLLSGIEQQHGAEQKPEGASPLRDQLIANFNVARAMSRDTLDALISRIQPRAVLSAEERIFFSALHDVKLDPERDVISPEAPEVVADLVAAPERARRNWIYAATIGLAAAAAFLQPWIWEALSSLELAIYRALAWLADLGASPDHTPFTSQVARPLAIAALLITALQWFINVNRHEPRVFRPIWREARSGMTFRQLILDPSHVALMTVILALADLTGRGATRAHVELALMLVGAGCALLAWVVFVTPERWWNVRSADEQHEQQIARDPITAMLGTVMVAAIWAVPWFLVVLPAGKATDLTFGAFFSAGCIGVISWVVSSGLARRWLIDRAAAVDIHRLWLDAAFAVVAFLLFSPLLRLLASKGVDGQQLATGAIIVGAPALYGVHLKATLGLRGKQSLWGALINGALAAMAAAMAGFALVVTSLLFPSNVIALLLVTLLPGAVLGAVATFLSRRGDRTVITSAALWAKCIVFGGVLFPLAALLLYMLEDTPFAPLGFIARTFSVSGSDLAMPLILLVLPVAFVLWPLFRVLARASGLVAPRPRWRAIVTSPWWGAIAMGLVGLVWHVGGVTFSVWPLALLIAIALWLWHGPRALVPIVAGTLPLIVQVGSPEWKLYSPGGVWGALAILLLARLAADTPLRERVLRREHLGWVEALVIVALLCVTVDDIALGRVLAEQSGVNRAGNPLMRDVVAFVHLDPSFMLTAVAIVIGASRMPATRFAVAVLAFSLVPEVIPLLSSSRAVTEIPFGLNPDAALSVLLVMFGARAWRTYAASGVGSSPLDRVSGTIDPRLTRMKNRGVWLSGAAVLTVTIWASGLAPGVNLAWPVRIDYQFGPSISATLALVLFTGLVGGNLWTDRVVWGGARIYPWTRLLLDSMAGWFLSSFAISAAGFAVLYLSLATQFGNTAFDRFGVGTRDVAWQIRQLHEDPGAIGLAVCVIAYLAFGIGRRIASERRADESWRATARRLWTTPRPTDPPRTDATPSAPPEATVKQPIAA